MRKKTTFIIRWQRAKPSVNTLTPSSGTKYFTTKQENTWFESKAINPHTHLKL